MLLSNLSAEQLVGVNGSAYGSNLSSMAWEVTAVFATICMALMFLPPGGHLKLPHLWPSQNPSSASSGTVTVYLLLARIAT